MEEILAGDVYTLTDEETGEEAQYEIVAVAEVKGAQYVAIVPADEEVEEYAILRVETEGEERTLAAIEDDDEWESVAAYFDNEIFSEIDYDEEN
ncbi:MAG: DUF1292 domain-containing protein [Clostridia bacterium]|nr:DUF1292 domain-containing protein [Clostridia bacterium]